MINDAVSSIMFYVMLTALISLVIYLTRKKKKDNSVKYISNVKSDFAQLVQSYFVQSYFVKPISNKGVKRLIIAIGFLLPLLVAMIICYNDARVIENDYGETFRVYDNSVFFGAFFFILISYWIFYLIIIWIYKGFQESKRI